VNLPDVILSKIRGNIESLVQGTHASKDLFDKAQNEIYHLMSTDSFHRFVKMEDSIIEASQISEVSLGSLTGSHGSKRDESIGASYASDNKDTPTRPYPSSKAEKIEKETEQLDQSIHEETPEEQYVL